MSGGYFEYYDSGLQEHADKLAVEIRYSKNIYSEETIKEFQNCLKFIRLAQVYMHRVDWLLSGDDGEDSFKKRLEKDLQKLQKEPEVVPTLRTCAKCRHFEELPSSRQARRCNCFRDDTEEDVKSYINDATECFGFSPCDEY